MSLREKLDAFRAQVNGDPLWTLPMPARYVIAQNSTIAHAEVNPDYTRRPEPAELLPVLDRLGTLVARKHKTDIGAPASVASSNTL